MSNTDIVLLPDLLLLEDYNGNWGNYLKALYSCYCNDFINYTPVFDGSPVRVRKDKKFQGMDLTFWHLISGGTWRKTEHPT